MLINSLLSFHQALENHILLPATLTCTSDKHCPNLLDELIKIYSGSYSLLLTIEPLLLCMLANLFIRMIHYTLQLYFQIQYKSMLLFCLSLVIPVYSTSCTILIYNKKCIVVFVIACLSKNRTCSHTN